MITIFSCLVLGIAHTQLCYLCQKVGRYRATHNLQANQTDNILYHVKVNMEPSTMCPISKYTRKLCAAAHRAHWIIDKYY
jgi:hypothetical protein